jgi:hypothetical protein
MILKDAPRRSIVFYTADSIPCTKPQWPSTCGVIKTTHCQRCHSTHDVGYKRSKLLYETGKIPLHRSAVVVAFYDLQLGYTTHPIEKQGSVHHKSCEFLFLYIYTLTKPPRVAGFVNDRCTDRHLAHMQEILTTFSYTHRGQLKEVSSMDFAA